MARRREVLIMVAPNGARLSKSDVPTVPLTPRELAAEARACRRAGAAAMHVHVRDAQGRHSLRAEDYRAALRAIRAAVGDDMALQITTEAAGIYDLSAQMAVVRALKPVFVSLALREFLPSGQDAARRRQVADFLRWMRGQGIWPQIILYAPEEVARLARLMKEGIIPWARPFLLFVLGRYGGRQAGPEMLDDFVKVVQDAGLSAAWMACAFGARQLDVLEQAAAAGGHVRVGFENGRELAPSVPAENNARLVAALAERLRARGMTPMPPARAKEVLRGSD